MAADKLKKTVHAVSPIFSKSSQIAQHFLKTIAFSKQREQNRQRDCRNIEETQNRHWFFVVLKIGIGFPGAQARKVILSRTLDARTI